MKAGEQALRRLRRLCLSLPESSETTSWKGFFVTPYGRGQWVSIWVDGRVNWGLVNRLVQRGYRVVALKRMIAALEN